MSRELTVAERQVAARLAVAEVLARAGNSREAEKLYNDTLMLAEDDSGANSALAGMVHLELTTFYERLERQNEARQAWERVRQILTGYFEKTNRHSQV